MKKASFIFLIFFIIAGVCVISCPKHEEHSKAIMKEINSIIDNEISKTPDENDNKTTQLFTTTLCSGISELIISRTLSVENYFMFSIGKITFDGKTRTVSYGILNHVFTNLQNNPEDGYSNL